MSDDRAIALILGAVGLVLGAAGIASIAFDSRDLTWNLLTFAVVLVAVALLDWVGVGASVRSAGSQTRWLVTGLVAAVIAVSGSAYLAWPTYKRWWLAQMVAAIAVVVILQFGEDETPDGRSGGGGFDGPWGP